MIKNWAPTPNATHFGIFSTSRKSRKVRVIPIPNMMTPSPTGIHFNSVPGIAFKNQVKCVGKNQAHAVPRRVHSQKRFTTRETIPDSLLNIGTL